MSRSRAVPLFATVCATVLAASLVAPGAASAEPGAKPAFTVSITVKTATGQVGQKVAVSGKVQGPGVKGLAVKVQRSDNGGAWKTVAIPRASSTGTYRGKVPLATAGTTSIRVVKTATTQARQGVSAVRKVKTFGWLNVTQQPAAALGGWDAKVTIGTKTYPHSIAMIYNDLSAFSLNLGKSCTTFRSTVGFASNGTDPGSESAKFTVQAAKTHTAATTPDLSISHDVTGAGSRSFTADITGMTILSAQGITTASGLVPAFGTPQVLCDVSRLPELPLSWFTLPRA